MKTNNLWAIVERNGDTGNVISEEVFNSRSDARSYLQALKRDIDDPSFSQRNLFIRQLRVTNRRG